MLSWLQMVGFKIIFRALILIIVALITTKCMQKITYSLLVDCAEYIQYEECAPPDDKCCIL